MRYIGSLLLFLCFAVHDAEVPTKPYFPDNPHFKHFGVISETHYAFRLEYQS
jgi:hypothetical protein